MTPVSCVLTFSADVITQSDFQGVSSRGFIVFYVWLQIHIGYYTVKRVNLTQKFLSFSTSYIKNSKHQSILL